MIQLAVPNLAGNEGRYLQECVETGFVSSVGPFVTRFEQMVAISTGAEAAVATSAGTTGLHLALVTAGVLPGDLVIMPAFTFIGSANAVAHCGASPWLVDVNVKDWCMDADLVRKILEEETEERAGQRYHRKTGRRVSALMPVYTMGLIPEMELFHKICVDYKLLLVADAAPAIGSSRGGKGVGTFADLTVISFNGNKTVTSGGGGAIVGNNTSLLQRAKHLSSTARVGGDYHHDAVGYNYRMTNLQAAVGCAQMENLSPFVAAKRRIRNVYLHALRSIAGITFFPDSPDESNACWLSGVVMPADGSIFFEQVARSLVSQGIQCRPFWKPIHLQPPFSDCFHTSTTVCDRLWNRILVLPSSTTLKEEEQSKAIEAVQQAFKLHV